METYIQIYKNKSKHTNLFLIILFGLSLLGAAGLIMTFLFDFNLFPSLNEGSYIILFSNSITTFLIVRSNKNRGKYFVAWNDHEIKYLLPKSKETEIIPLEDIKTISFNKSEVIITLNDSNSKQFNLNHFFYPERKIIRNFFDELHHKLEMKPQKLHRVDL